MQKMHIKNKKIYILYFIVTYSLFSHTMGCIYNVDTYKQKPLTVQNLLETGNKELPADVINKVQKFFKEEELLCQVLVQQFHPEVEKCLEKNKEKFLKKHLNTPLEKTLEKNKIDSYLPKNGYCDISLQMAIYTQVARELLEKYKAKGIESKTMGANYVLRLPEAYDHYVKISGPSNRYTLKLADQGGFKKEDIRKYDHRKTLQNTYQTASRKFGYLRLTEAIEKFKLDKLEVPVADLVNINPKKPNSCEDRDCIFVQKILKPEDGYTPLGGIKDKNKVLDKETIRQLVIAIIYTGLWDDFSGSLFVNKRKGKIAIIDAEQPANTKTEQMFNKDINKLKINIAKGIDRLLACFSENSKQQKWVHEFYQTYITILELY